MIILGIDPGSVVCGYGVVDMQGNNSFSLIEYGVIHAKKSTPEFYERLKEIYKKTDNIIKRTNPDCSAVESMFYAKNAQSLMKLSHARASAILAATMNDLPILEYSPKEVKKSVTGRGAASKEQVSFMVRKILNIKETPEFFDATDALAVAICHGLKSNMPQSKGSSWSDYVKNNPNKVL